MVSMAIMVASFRALARRLARRRAAGRRCTCAPAAATAALLDAGRAAANRARCRACARVEFLRVQNVCCSIRARPRVACSRARSIERDVAARLPLVEATRARPRPARRRRSGSTRRCATLWLSRRGRRVELPLAGQATPRSSSPASGATTGGSRARVLIERDDYVALTGDRDAQRRRALARRRAPIADRSAKRVRRRRPARAIASSSRRPARSARCRSRSSTARSRSPMRSKLRPSRSGSSGSRRAFGALVLARRREFGMLRHLGMTRRADRRDARDRRRAARARVGVAAGIALGGAISLVLIYVVNRQSFHWSMDLAVPVVGLFAVRACAASRSRHRDARRGGRRR